MKYPNGHFRPKLCRACGASFVPDAPCRLYCSDTCSKRGWREAYFQRNYGISVAQYDAAFKKQRGKCAICGGKGFVMDESRHTQSLVVDHCHKTGKVRSLLCHNCNRALGLLADDPKRMRRCAEYIEQAREGATTIPSGSTPKRAEARCPAQRR